MKLREKLENHHMNMIRTRNYIVYKIRDARHILLQVDHHRVDSTVHDRDDVGSMLSLLSCHDR